MDLAASDDDDDDDAAAEDDLAGSFEATAVADDALVSASECSVDMSSRMRLASS